MARKPNILPSYLLHKPTGQARIRIDGKDYYLGEFGSEKSRITYGQLVAAHAGGLPIDPIALSKRGSVVGWDSLLRIPASHWTPNLYIAGTSPSLQLQFLES